MCPENRSVPIFILVLTLCLPAIVPAQSGLARSDGTAAPRNKQASSKQEPEQENQIGLPPLTLVGRSSADYLSGEANVAVSGNQNPVIRLGLSPNGATIIEFPASDRLFNIIPGNSQLVTVDESPTKEGAHFIIARPGDDFGAPKTMINARRAPVASIIVQMRSGLVVTLFFYPVPELWEQAHRVVVTYDKNEVMAARRAAGLATNLSAPAQEREKSRPLSMHIVPPYLVSLPAAAPSPVLARSQAPRPLRAVADTAEVDTPGYFSKSSFLWFRKSDEPASAASRALSEAISSPARFKKWSHSIYGLSLSAWPAEYVDKGVQLVVIAVRNTKSSDAYLVPGQPEIYLETRDGKGRPIEIEAVRKLATETTVVGDVIPVGFIRYYALAFEAPAIGSGQRLRVAIGQTIEADEPASASLPPNR